MINAVPETPHLTFAMADGFSNAMKNRSLRTIKTVRDDAVYFHEPLLIPYL
jgi:hypothetical protein